MNEYQKNTTFADRVKALPRRRVYFTRESLSARAELAHLPAGETASIIASLESELENNLGLPAPVALNGGRTAIRLLLESSGLETGSEILVPAYTFGMVYPAIRASGFSPVAVDIDPETFQMDPAQAENSITPKTGAIIATHLFGQPCDIKAMRSLAERRGLLLLEDCAQAIGAKFDDSPLGSFGTAGISSFDKSKPLQGIRGGVAFGKDSVLLSKVREKAEAAEQPASAPVKELLAARLEDFIISSPLWRVFSILFSYEPTQRLLFSLYRSGETSKTTSDISSGSASLSLPALNALIVKYNMSNLPERLEQRRRLWALYKELLGNTLAFQKTYSGSSGSVHMVVAKSPVDPMKLRFQLALKGIDIAIRSEVADDCLKTKGSVADIIYKCAVALPISDYMTEKDVYRTADAVLNALKKLS